MAPFIMNPSRFAVAATQFASMYEAFDDLTTVRKQHFVEWFSGDDIDSIWNTTNKTGTGTVTMVDEIDGGLSVKTQAVSNGETQINFNNKRQYDYDGSVFLSVVKRVNASSLYDVGLSNVIDGSATDQVLVRDYTGDTYVKLKSADASTTSDVDSSVTVNTNWNLLKTETSTSNVKLHINGVLEVTKTTNRPTKKLQPIFLIYTASSSADEMRVRYLEAYNT